METWWTETKECKLERLCLRCAIDKISIHPALLQKRVKFKDDVAVREVSRLPPDLWYSYYDYVEFRKEAYLPTTTD